MWVQSVRFGLSLLSVMSGRFESARSLIPRRGDLSDSLEASVRMCAFCKDSVKGAVHLSGRHTGDMGRRRRSAGRMRSRA